MISDLEQMSPASAELLRSSADEAANREDAGVSPLPSPLPPLTSSAPRNPSDAATEDANLSYTVLQAYWKLQEAREQAQLPPHSLARAASHLGVAPSWLYRRIKRWERNPTYEGLLPNFHKSGRPSWLKKLAAILGDDAIDRAVAEVSGLKLDTESNTAAWRLYAQSDRCPEAIARVVLDPRKTSKHSLPPSFRQATKLNEALHNAHRGPRRLALKGMWTPRSVDILPGDIFTADDTTPIWGWWVPWREDKDHKFGVKLLQGQFLPVIDVASQCAVSFVLIARESSSYRASDIWHLFGHTFETVGLPRLGWQLERGSWESNLIAGVELDYKAGDVTLSRRVGGLRQLPTTITDWHRAKLGSTRVPRVDSGVPRESEGPGFDHSRDGCATPEQFIFPRHLQTWTSYLPKSKSIEAWFNRSQTFEGTLWGALGRDQMRKPYEKAKKLFQTCQRGTLDPRQYFLSQAELIVRLRSMLEYLNNEPMEGEVFSGVPRQKFDAARAEYPLQMLPEDQRWLYRRDWKACTITNGWARLRLTHEVTGERYSLFYTHPRFFADHEGEDVVVYYDRENFEAPAQIILARTGDYLCDAQYEERRGSFLDGDRSGHELRAAWRNAVTAAYATIVPHAPSRQLPAEIQARRAGGAERPGGAAVPAASLRPGVPPEQGTRIEASLPPPSRRPASMLPPAPTPEQFSRRQARLAEEAEAARALGSATQ